MNQSFFKDILEQEIHSVFLNPAEFGESVTPVSYTHLTLPTN